MEAEVNFKKAIQLNPQNDKAHANYANMLGCVYVCVLCVRGV